MPRMTPSHLVAPMALCCALSACGERIAQPAAAGEPERGRQALRAYGCGSCHTIPGVRGADSLVGPPLQRIGKRAYLGGVLPNTPENMQRWIRFPQDVNSRTAMPNMDVSERDARDMTAYLYTLK